MSKAASSSSHRATASHFARHDSDPPHGPSGEHLSLDNPQITINNPDIWTTAGSGPTPQIPLTAPNPCSESRAPPAGQGRVAEPVTVQMDPANLQCMITAAIQQGIAAGLSQFSRPSSLVSELSHYSYQMGVQAGPSAGHQNPERYSRASSADSHSHLSEEEGHPDIEISLTTRASLQSNRFLPVSSSLAFLNHCSSRPGTRPALALLRLPRLSPYPLRQIPCLPNSHRRQR